MRPLFLGHNGAGQDVELTGDERRTHMHVIGSSGSGKSKFLEHLMRQDLQNRQGFCLIDPHGSLYEAVMQYAGFRCLQQDIIPLNLSEPGTVVGFNPFQRAANGDVAVQVDRRIQATMHAWGVADTNQTPTLARTLRLIYTVMLEQDLGLPQVAHLIDFNAHVIRGQLIERLSTPLIQKEWLELQQLKARDFREETLSAKNRLFKFLTSPTLARFMGVPGRSINLSEVIAQGKVLLVNLAPSDYLSKENARVFGALLVNEFFECAMRRKPTAGKPPQPYYLFLDEFQDFVSIDIADMLDQVRKFGLFLTLAHQRFGQLDENITDAVLTNCRIKAVFGGLRAESARMMAEELFIGKLDPMKVKAAIYQTKFWPRYGRDKTYTRGSSKTQGTSATTGRTQSTGSTESTSSGTFSSTGESIAYYEGNDWLATPEPTGRSATSSSAGSTSGHSTATSLSESHSQSETESESFSESESESDIPIFIPVPFQELSSVQYLSLDEQLHQMTAALKEQFPRHCFIKIHGQDTQPLRIPTVRDFYLSEQNLNEYREEKLAEHGGLPTDQVDRILHEQEQQLMEQLKAASAAEEPPPPADPPKKQHKTPNIFDGLFENP
jgi:hypothetical protein